MHPKTDIDGRRLLVENASPSVNAAPDDARISITATEMYYHYSSSSCAACHTDKYYFSITGGIKTGESTEGTSEGNEKIQKKKLYFERCS